MDEHYPSKIIDHFVSDIKTDLLDIKINTSKSIDALTDKISTHNGRLSKVEQFMWAFGGAMTVVTALVMPYFFYYTTQLQNKVDNLNKTLSQYEIKIEK